MRRPLITLLLAVGAGVLVAAQQPVQLKAIGMTGSITANGGAVTLPNTGGLASLLIQTSGTFSLTWELQCAGDSAAIAFDTDDELPVTLVSSSPAPTDGVSTNAEALYMANIAGCTAVRVIATAFTSGTMNVSLQAITSGGGGGGTSGGGGGGTFNGVLLDAPGGDALTNTALNALKVDIVSGAGAGGTGIVDRTGTFTPGSTSFTLGGGFMDETSPDVCTEGAPCAFRLTSARQLRVDGTGGTFPVASITTSVTPGTSAAHLGKAEDAVHTSADTGVLALAVRRDANTSLVDTTGDNAPLQVDALGNLKVNIVAGAAAGGTSLTDNAAFTPATTSFTPIGGEVDDTATTAATENSGAAARLTTQRAIHVNLRTSAGAELTAATDKAEDSPHTTADTGPVALERRIDVAASSADASGDYATKNQDALGLSWTRMLDPCSGVAKQYLPIDIVTAATTEITPALAGASTHYYICSVALVTNAANNVAIVDDNTDGCGSPTAGVMGGVTAAEGFTLAANGGLTLGNGAGSIARTVTANSVLCIITSAPTQLSGTITVVAAP